jgi:sigma-E factor negative regulatory protein RseC
VIEEQVTVTKTHGEFAWVKTAEGKAGCSSCASSGSCGVSLLSGLWKNRAEISFKVLNQVSAKTGDTAILVIPEATFIKGAIALYLLPLIALLSFAIAAKLLFNPLTDLPIIAAGLFGLFASLVWLRIRHNRATEQSLPEINRIIPASQQTMRLHTEKSTSFN